MARPAFKSVTAYIASFPRPVAVELKKVRRAIKDAAPKGTVEKISYGIPFYQYKGRLVYFAGFTSHISVYPAPRRVPVFKKELAKYKGGVGTVQFPLGKPMPLKLIQKIVRYRADHNE